MNTIIVMLLHVFVNIRRQHQSSLQL